ncbi:MAG: branched-chain amino acid ABC transporter permease [Armatimonadota bacterium]|nr:branched-chain amino acid ABC transporter permease [Armatimonadota bacterium]
MIIGVLAIFALMWLEQALSFVLGPYWMRILMLSGIAIILAVSLNLVNGFAGQFSLGHAGFYAIGAYISAIVTKTWGNQIINSLTTGLHLSPSLATGVLMLTAIIVGLVSASIAGLLVGLPSLRLRGDYLAIATLGFGEAIRVIIQNSETLGAQRGLRGIGSYTTFVWIFVFVILVIIFARNLAISSHGRALFAIRDDEIAAESAGVAVFKYKVMAFAMSAGWAGIAGALFAHYDAYLSPQTFGFMKSVDIVVMVVLGGGGSITGSVIAAVALTALPEVLREYLPRDFQNFRMVVYALMLVLLMLTRPQGIFGRTELSIVGIWRALRGKIRKTHPVEEAGR